MEWGYTLTGLAVGFLVGMTGVGGGSLMTPMLIFVFGIPAAVAVGTDLLFASVTKAGGIWVHHLRRTINWRIVGLLALGSLPASLAVTLFLGQSERLGKDYQTLIGTSLGIALILTAIALFYRHRVQAFAQARIAQAPDWLRQIRDPMTVLFGVVLGALVTLSSVGAGALGAVVLTFLYPRLAAVRIVGTDLAHAVPLTAIAGLGHAHLGTVDYALLGSLLIGSLPGIYLGSHLGASIPERVMRPILATVIMAIGIKFVW